MLDGLGFKAEDFARDANTFCGGQQRRLLLAKLLLSAPDVMLLDEPSNHLDIDTTRWLENYLAQQPEAMLIVSHDRYFLDKVTNKTFELHQRKITSYPGNFQQYVRLRDERYERQLKECESQREYIEKQEEYIRRVHYGQLAKQAQSRQKALDKLERVEKPTKVAGPNMHFGEVSRTGDIVFHVEDLTQALRRQGAVREPELRPAARQAARHHGAERLRQDDAAAHPAGRRGADQRASSSAGTSSSPATSTSTSRSSTPRRA